MPFKYNALLGLGLDNTIPLDGAGKIPATYLPSYVDDVEEYNNLAAFPATGETGKIYVAIDTGFVYRWSGSVYVQIGVTAAAGSTTQVQFNDGGAFGGDAGLVFNKTTDALTIAGPVVHPLGAAATPSLTFTGDLNTGFWSPSADTLAASTAGTEAMRINSECDVLIGTTTGFASNSSTATGHRVTAAGAALHYISSTTALFVGRQSNDGTLVSLRQDGVEEGTISVSGTTVSYNGAHLSRWSQLPSGAERTEILRGTILSNIDEMCEWGEEDNEQLNRMKVSDVEGDKNVSGVFQAWDDDDDTYTNDFYCAMTGDFIIRIAEGVTVERGDLLMSAGDGTAKPQDDDIIRSKTIAKVTSTNVSCTYEDGSYCVPCVLMAC